MGPEYEIVFQAFQWDIYHYSDTNFEILGWAMDPESNPLLVRFPNFAHMMIVELPESDSVGRPIQWNQALAEKLFSTLATWMKKDKPSSFMYLEADKLYYFDNHRKHPHMRLMFSTGNGVRYCKNILGVNCGIDLGIYKKIKANVYELDFDSIRKLMTIRNTRYCGWLSARGVEPKVVQTLNVGTKDVMGNTIYDNSVDERLSKLTSGSEWICDWKTLVNIDDAESKEWSSNWLAMTFDFETNSENIYKFPSMWEITDDIKIISIEIKRLGVPGNKIISLVQANCFHIEQENNMMLCYNNEEDLLIAFMRMIEEIDPDVLCGHNILGFDIPYFQARLKLYELEWPNVSRLIEAKIYERDIILNTAGAGQNNMKNIIIPGRMTIDTYYIIKRLMGNLTSYKLDSLASKFLGSSKHDVTASEMFVAFHRYDRMRKECDAATDQSSYTVLTNHIKLLESDAYKKAWKRKHPKAFTLSNNLEASPLYYIVDGQCISINWCSNELYNSLIKKSSEVDACRFLYTRVLRYCIQDVVLVTQLIETLNITLGLLESGSVGGMNPIDTYTGGQGRGVFSNLYDFSYRNNVAMNKIDILIVPYKGGYVEFPTTGLHKKAGIIDFNSLYPSLIIAFNICYSTLIPNEYYHSVNPDHCHTVKIPRKPDSDDISYLDQIEHDEEFFYVRYIKAEYKKGVLPAVVAGFLDARAAVRQEQKKYAYRSLYWTVLEQRQLAFKLLANSSYGVLGAGTKSKYPCIQNAMAICALGAASIQKVSCILRNNYASNVFYGDTDSCFFKLRGTKKTNFMPLMREIAKQISSQMPKPLNLELEKGVLCWMIQKKNYMCYVYAEDGTFKMDEKTGRPEIYSRGGVAAKRDKCRWLKELYWELAHIILGGGSMRSVIAYILEESQKLLDGQVSYQRLEMNVKITNAWTLANYPLRLFSEHMTEIGKPIADGERINYIIIKKDYRYIGECYITPELYLASLGTTDYCAPFYEYYLFNLALKNINRVVDSLYLDRLDKYSDLVCNYKNTSCGLHNLTMLMRAVHSKGLKLSTIVESMDQIDAGLQPIISDEKKIRNVKAKDEIEMIEKPLITRHLQPFRRPQ